MALAVLGRLMQMRIGAFGVNNGDSGWIVGSRVSTAGRKDFRNSRPGDAVGGIVS